jgi:predicted permease
MDTLLQDLRYALRTLSRSPGFTAAAVMTLALGIGAATAGFSLLNWVLVRPVPGVQDHGDLGIVWVGRQDKDGFSPGGLSAEEQTAIMQRVPALRALVGMMSNSVNVVASDQAPRHVSAEFVQASYFSVLGARPSLGRAFVGEEDEPPSGSSVTMISERLWRELFGSRPDVVGKTILVNQLPLTVIGVAAKGFRGTERFGNVDIWLPSWAQGRVMHFPSKLWPDASQPYAFVVERWAGASFADLHSQLQASISAAAASRSEWHDDLSEVKALVFPGIGLAPLGRGHVTRTLTLVMAIAALVLLIMAANVSNLLLLRGARRQEETAVRLALGAGRGRLVRQYLTESALLGVFGAGAGALLALWLAQLFSGARLTGVFRPIEGIRLDLRVLAFAAAVGIVTAVTAGIVPAIFASRADLAQSLKDGVRTQVGSASRVRIGLATAQVAIALTLVVGALLFARTLENLAKVDLGFDPSQVTVYKVNPHDVGYEEPRGRSYLQTLQERVTALPGVTSVSLADGFSGLPFSGGSFVTKVQRTGRDTRPFQANTASVSPDYFHTLGISLLRGRGFDAPAMLPDTARGARVAVLSESLVHKLFGMADPVGQTVELNAGDGRRYTVVGIVGDIRWQSKESDFTPFIYEPLGQTHRVESAYLLVRSERTATDLSAAITDVARRLDPSLPIDTWGPLSVVVARWQSERTLFLKLLGVLSSLTLLLTAVGIYGLVAYVVVSRTREFGIRVALGAGKRDITRAAIRPAIAIALVGVCSGVIGVAVLVRFIAKWLYRVTPLDPASLAAAAILLVVAVFAASWIPARRAARIEPMEALRYE